MTEERLRVAEWLLAHGAGASARRVLGDLRGAPANRLRLASREATLRPGVYALVTLPDGAGVAVPLVPEPGRSRAADPVFRRASERALDAARAHLRAPALPALRFAFEERLAVFGPSIGLPAALAFIIHYAASRAPAMAVLGSGELDESGRVERVGQMSEKLAVAALEREVGRILVPAGEAEARGADRVATLAEAVEIVMGRGPIAPDVGHLHVDAVLRRVHADRDPARGIELLSALPRDALAPADRARVLLELGSLHRHHGQSGEAARLHAEARDLLIAERAVIGAEAVERYELECAATALDDFRCEETIAALSARLGEPFLKLRNELRCRGMLAQAVAMTGRFAEAVEIRLGNLALHERSDALRKVAPVTHAHLALDAARAGDAALFERHARAAIEATRPGDEAQERFDAAAIVRGLAALGRDGEALAWARDEAPVLGIEAAAARAPWSVTRMMRGGSAVEGHPEVSVARALTRALRRTGSAREAVSLAARVRAPEAPSAALSAWCAALAALEGSLAIEALGDHASARHRREQAREALRRAHPAATRHHGELMWAEGEALSAAIDRVYY